jgi:hypothetical protein
MSELVTLFELFDNDGVSLVFLDMNIDTSTSQGRLLRHILAAFAEYESDVKSDYTRANRRHAASLGLPWGRAPFGYEKASGERNYVINEAKARVVRGIFSRYAQGWSQYRIAAYLRSTNATRPGEDLWRARSVGRILDSPAYAALCLVDHELRPAVWKPIVSRDLFDKVQRIKSQTAAVYKNRRNRGRQLHLLTGLLICGYCGKKLHFRSKPGTKAGIYRCVDSFGKGPCKGGGVDAARAERDIGAAFLHRTRFVNLSGERERYVSPQLSWEQASLSEQRRLLALSIEKVLVIPWRQGRSSNRGQPRKKDLQITWIEPAAVEGIRTGLTFIVSGKPLSRDRTEVSNGRPESYRKAQVRLEDERKRVRAERASAYSREWNQFRAERLQPSDGKLRVVDDSRKIT